MVEVVLGVVTVVVSGIALCLSARANRTARAAYDLDAEAAARAGEFQDVEWDVRYEPQEQGATMWLTNIGSTDACHVWVIASVGRKRGRFEWGDVLSGESKAVTITARVVGDGTYEVPSPFKIVWQSPRGTLREQSYTVPQIS